MRAISEECRKRGLSLHMDGARFANACASLGCSPAEMSWKSGVDVLCFGGAKNGMAMGEAVLFFDRAMATDFDYRCKQAGQLASKMRFLSAPWVGMLESGAWLRNAEHANRCARQFAEQIAGTPGVRLAQPVEANAVFLLASEEILDRLRRLRLELLHLHRRRGPLHVRLGQPTRPHRSAHPRPAPVRDRIALPHRPCSAGLRPAVLAASSPPASAQQPERPGAFMLPRPTGGRQRSSPRSANYTSRGAPSKRE